MSWRRLPSAAAIVAGVVAALGVLVPGAAPGFGVGWLVLDEATRADRALAGLLWGGASGLLAFAAGGWLASRVAARRGGGGAVPTGLAVGAVALLLIVLLVRAVLGEAMDFHSVGVGLGLVEIDPAASPPAAAPVAEPTIDPRDYARDRTLTAGAYAAALALLLLGAAALGGVVGAAERAGDGRR